MEGCVKCSSAAQCSECNSLYFLRGSDNCVSCSSVLEGCLNCANDSFCLSCSSTHFLSSENKCELCTQIEGCLSCTDSSTCLLCATGFFLTAAKECHSCDVMEGCYSCISETVCSSCIGGFAIDNQTQRCEVVEMQAEAIQSGVLKLKTFYLNESTLKHELYSLGSKFLKKDIDLKSSVKLYVVERATKK